MKTIILLLSLVTPALAQFTPPPSAAYISNGSGGWTPATSTSTSGAVSFTPPPAGIYCFNTSTNQWVPATSLCLGGGGGGGGSVGTAGQIQMVGSTAGSFAASSLTDNGTAIAISEPVNTTAAAAVVESLISSNSAGAVLELGGSASGVDTMGIQSTTSHELMFADFVPSGLYMAALTAANGGSGAGYFAINSLAVLGWHSNAISPGTTAPDTGFSRDSAGVVDLGNGTQGNTSGRLNLASVNGTTIPASATLTQTIASGTFTVPVTALAANSCDVTATTATATGAVVATDALTTFYVSDPTGVTGYGGGTSGGISIRTWLTANQANLKRCNETSASITPSALTLGWKVTR
jgi:hypothetical protein